jgi:hypothetical protein
MKLLLGVLIFICLLLAACGRPTQAPVTPDEGVKETPLLTDADIDKASVQVLGETKELLGIEGGESPVGEMLPSLADKPSQGGLNPQAVLPNTSGFVYYLKFNPNPIKGPALYSIYRHDQQSDALVLVYSGNRAIQTVAGSADGKIIVVSMKETTPAISDYEIFLIAFDEFGNPGVIQFTNDTLDNINVSVSRNFSRFAYEEPVFGVATVKVVRHKGSFQFSTTVLSSSSEAQRQPSLSGDGRQLVLVRDLANGTDRVLTYDIALNRYVSVVTSSNSLEYPSLSDNGLKVAWLENSTSDQIFLKNLITATSQSVVSGSSLNHPHLTADGKFITYQWGGVLVTKDLTTSQVMTLASPPFLSSISFYAPTWQKLFNNKIAGAVTNIRLGYPVSVSGDLMVVGAPRENSETGAAYVYQRNSLGVWSLVKKLLASDVGSGSFGSSVAISGNTVVIGAPNTFHDLPLETRSGAAYIFAKDQGGTNNWGQVKKLIASDDADYDNFGNSVSISGNVVVVGAFAEDHDTDGNGIVDCVNSLDPDCDVGAAYIFSKDQGGVNNWGQVKKLIASDDARNDNFGNSVSISSNTVVIGASHEDHDTDGNGTDDSNPGAAYIFSKDQGGVNNWGQVKKLIASDDARNDNFGNSVSISSNTVVIGASHEDHDTDGNGTDDSNPGAAYIFSKDQGGVNNWGQVKKLIASDDAVDDQFGSSVAISGTTVVVGASHEDYDTDGIAGDELDVGAAYLFQRNQDGNNSWGKTSKLTAYDGVLGDLFGYSVAISGSTVVVGAPSDDNASGTEAGAVYFYQ